MLLLRKGHCSLYFPPRSTVILTGLQVSRPLIVHCGYQAFGPFIAAHNNDPYKMPKERAVSYVCRIVGDVIINCALFSE